ncbi:MAG: hypothetical protein JRI86_14755, partial [Deltaproteobacteria bacterium]|nr:hypothetical protein [Deltaproteobacteria bacterium]
MPLLIKISEGKNGVQMVDWKPPAGDSFNVIRPSMVSIAAEKNKEIHLQNPSFQPGVNYIKLYHDGYVREMLVELPNNYSPDIKYPVIFGFHGSSGKMDVYSNRFLKPFVNSYEIITVTPQGISNSVGQTGWNGFPNHSISNTDDVGFVQKTLRYLENKLSIDTKKVYATGFSSGGIFCHRLALESDIFAAIAPVAGSLSTRLPVPKNRPRISILQINGENDPQYKGGVQHRGEAFHSAEKAMELWTKNHQRSVTKKILSDKRSIKITKYSSDNSNYEILSYLIKGEGHRISDNHISPFCRY